MMQVQHANANFIFAEDYDEKAFFYFEYLGKYDEFRLI